MSERIRKVNEEIRKAVGQFMQRNLPDHSGLFTITAVETSPDLKKATIWYGYLGPKVNELEKLIRSERGACQKYVNSVMHLKFVPKIDFQLDNSGDYAQKISAIIREIK